jgi:integrase
MGRKGNGVEARPTSIRVQFVLDGETCRETLRVNGAPLKPTPANLKYAARVIHDVRARITSGTFDYAEFFPDSARARPAAATTFADVADAWLKSKGQLEAATKDQYANAVAMWKRLFESAKMASLPFSSITYQQLAALTGGTAWRSAKSCNNYLIPLRGVFAFAYHGPRAASNPMLGILNMRAVKKLPDPLTVDERDRILWDLGRYDPSVGAYFRFAFYTGMRPEEIIALRWGDIDWARRTARVQRVRTFRGSEREGSKTHAERDVDLCYEALAAIDTMKAVTFLKRGDVFENPHTGEPWHDERAQRDTYWAPALKRLGIRSRRPYATRHTYATALLMSGVPPAYIAAQLGHANTKMLFDRYARWLPEADSGNARAAAEAAMKRTGT